MVAVCKDHPARDGEKIRAGNSASDRRVSATLEETALFAVFRVVNAATIPSIPIWPTSNQELFSDFR